MSVDVYLETGTKRTFAGALEWPGWCRSGRDEQSALQALLDYAPRYREALGTAARGLLVPKTVSGLKVVERLRGDSTTDFGAPGMHPAYDARTVDPKDVARLARILEACWAAFDAAAKAAAGKTLATGPRGGGRDIARMRAHVLEADASYFTQLGGRYRGSEMKGLRDAFVEALGARARGELPDRGPRGGARWSAPYATRRSAWHALDHAWEIEDRAGK